jgi:FMN reductase
MKEVYPNLYNWADHRLAWTGIACLPRTLFAAAPAAPHPQPDRQAAVFLPPLFPKSLISNESMPGTCFANSRVCRNRFAASIWSENTMTKKLNVVAVSGGLQRPSRTLALVEELLVSLGELLPISVRLIELGEIAHKFAGAVHRSQLPESVEADLRAIETADLLVVASPVYRASYTGLFKHLFDFVHHEALIGVPVLLAATGGSERHALVIDHQLRPLFAFFQADALPIGVYATEKDFDGYSVSDPALQERIALAVARAVPHLKSILAPASSLAGASV